MFFRRLFTSPVLTPLNLVKTDSKEFPKILTASSLYTSALKSEKQQVLPQETISQEESPDKLYRLVEVEVRGNDPAVLNSYAWYATTAAHHLGIEVGRSWTPEKPHHERYTVLRAIHVNKKCRVQYEFRTYFQFMQFLKLTGSTADTFLEYIQRNLPEGVSMKVTRIALETLPDHIKAPENNDLVESS